MMTEESKPKRNRHARKGIHTAQLGARLRSARLSAGMTQRDVAGKFGSDEKTYLRYETGERLPFVDDIFKLAEVLNVSVTWLLDLPTDLSEHEDRLLAAFRALSERDRQLMLDLVVRAANTSVSAANGPAT